MSHPLHKSVINIDFISDFECKISISLIDHDLEDALSLIKSESTPKEIINKGFESKEIWNSLFKEYCSFSALNKKFYLEDLLSVSIRGDEVVFEYRLIFDESILSFEFENSLFINLFPNQKNLVFINKNGKTQQTIFNRELLKKEFVLNH